MAFKIGLPILCSAYIIFVTLITFFPYLSDLSQIHISGYVTGLSQNNTVISSMEFTDDTFMPCTNLVANLPDVHHLSYMLYGCSEKSSSANIRYIYLILFSEIIIGTLLLMALQQLSVTSRKLVRALIFISVILFMVSTSLNVYATRSDDTLIKFTYQPMYTVNGKISITENYQYPRLLTKFSGQIQFTRAVCMADNLVDDATGMVVMIECSPDSLFDSYMLIGLILRAVSVVLMLVTIAVCIVDMRRPLDDSDLESDTISNIDQATGDEMK